VFHLDVRRHNEDSDLGELVAEAARRLEALARVVRGMRMSTTARSGRRSRASSTRAALSPGLSGHLEAEALDAARDARPQEDVVIREDDTRPWHGRCGTLPRVAPTARLDRMVSFTRRPRPRRSEAVHVREGARC
jgi:hypothetical protein